MRNFVICALQGDKMKADEMSWECSMQGRGDICIKNFGWKI